MDAILAALAAFVGKKVGEEIKSNCDKSKHHECAICKKCEQCKKCQDCKKCDCGAMQLSLTKLQNQLNQKTKDLKQQKTNFSSLFDGLCEKNDDIDECIQKSKKKCENVEKSYDDLNQKYRLFFKNFCKNGENVNQCIENYNAMVENNEKTTSDLQKGIEEANQKYNFLFSNICETGASDDKCVNDLTSTLKKLKDNNESLKREKTDLKKQFDDLTKSKSSEDILLENARSQIEALKTKNKTANQKYADLKILYTNLQESKKDEDTAFQKATDKISDLQKDKQEINQKLSKLNEDYKTLQTNLDKSKNTNNSYLDFFQKVCRKGDSPDNKTPCEEYIAQLKESSPTSVDEIRLPNIKILKKNRNLIFGESFKNIDTGYDTASMLDPVKMKKSPAIGYYGLAGTQPTADSTGLYQFCREVGGAGKLGEDPTRYVQCSYKVGSKITKKKYSDWTEFLKSKPQKKTWGYQDPPHVVNQWISKNKENLKYYPSISLGLNNCKSFCNYHFIGSKCLGGIRPSKVGEGVLNPDYCGVSFNSKDKWHEDKTAILEGRKRNPQLYGDEMCVCEFNI